MLPARLKAKRDRQGVVHRYDADRPPVWRRGVQHADIRSTEA